jgi:hypothetical protein
MDDWKGKKVRIMVYKKVSEPRPGSADLSTIYAKW